MRVPKSNPNVSHAYGMPELAKRLQPSILGKLIEINYELHVFVKHDAWNEWGRGKLVRFPIKILTPPQIYREPAQLNI